MVYSFQDQITTTANELQGSPVFTVAPRSPYPFEVDAMAASVLQNAIFDEIFADSPQAEWYLHCHARALAGEVLDGNKAYMVVGHAIAGREQLEVLCKRAFGEYTTYVSDKELNNVLLCTSHDGSAGWLEGTELYRFVMLGDYQDERFGSEEKPAKVSGAALSSIMGEQHRVRNGAETVDVRRMAGVQATPFLWYNDMPEFVTDNMVGPAGFGVEVFRLPFEFVKPSDCDTTTDESQRNHKKIFSHKMDMLTREDRIVAAYRRRVLDAYSSEQQTERPQSVEALHVCK